MNAAATHPGPRSVPRGARRALLLDAALEVLATEGARGLTHRAADRRAGLPEGSASNHFRTREALLEATLAHHAARDLRAAGAEGAESPQRISRRQARDAIIAAAERILRPDERALVARYELFLEASRRPALHAELSRARARFVAAAERILAASGCERPGAHGAQLVACLDGLLLDQVIATPTSLGRDGIADAVDRLLAAC